MRSSTFAAAGNAFEPVTPRLVAFIASTACSPSSWSSVTRRSAALTAVALCMCIVWPVAGIDVPLVPANAAADAEHQRGGGGNREGDEGRAAHEHSSSVWVRTVFVTGAGSVRSVRGWGVAESAEELYRRALAAADADGRLPIPPLDEWDTFPFEGVKGSH